MPWSDQAETLASRVRPLLSSHPGYQEKRMFGGLCFLLNGNMCCGVTGEGRLMVRVGPDAYAAALRDPHANEMDFTGRPLKGMVYVDAPATTRQSTLEQWVQKGIDFAGRLPVKSKK